MLTSRFLISSGLGLIFSGTGYFMYDGSRKIQHPVFQSGLVTLQKDKGIRDYCGENINAGWFIKKGEIAKEGNIKFEFNVVGSSGKLQTILIGDSEKHSVLMGINDQLLQFEQEKPSKTEQEIEEFQKEWTVNLDDFKIIDTKTKHDVETTSLDLDSPVPNDEKIWRIKSLGVQVDDDNGILILPLPESKRPRKSY